MSLGGTSSADCVGAEIVSVGAAEFAPSVTEFGVREHAAGGVEPFTVQDSCTASLKDPFTGLIVMMSVTCAPRRAVKLAEADCSEKSDAVNVAIRKSSEVIVRLQVPVPVQFVLQPENADPGAGESVRLTVVAAAKLAVQDVVQSIPAGLLVTVPLPLPASLANRIWDVGGAPPSITET